MAASVSTAAATSYIRDRFTWFGYFMLAYYAYLQATLGPLMPFLRDELTLSYTVSAMHLSAFALGMIVAGLTGDRLAARFGRKRVLWGGGAGMALGALALITAQTPALTIAASLLMGMIGSYTLVMVQATLADHQGARSAIALTEANVCASISATLAPALVSASENAGIGWRLAPIAGVIAWTIMLFLYRDLATPRTRMIATDELRAMGGKQRLPGLFWVFWVVIVLGVSVEWCMIFWGADFLENSVGLSKVTATGLMTVFFIATVLGRLIGSRMTRSTRPIKLLIAATLLVVVGFPIFWLGQATIINVIGLFIVGLGVANLFPMTLAAVNEIAPTMSNEVSARAALGAGTAILISPQILGTVADNIGIFNAYGIAGGLSIAVLALTVVAWRAGKQR